MISVYDKNGNEETILEDSDINDMHRYKTLEVTSLNGVENILTTYSGYSINLYNSSTISIENVDIPAWSRWFFPFSTLGDTFGMIIYPDARFMYIVGRANNSWYIHKVY